MQAVPREEVKIKIMRLIFKLDFFKIVKPSWISRIYSAVESQFFEPPREAKLGSKNRMVGEIGSKITLFN